MIDRNKKQVYSAHVRVSGCDGFYDVSLTQNEFQKFFNGEDDGINAVMDQLRNDAALKGLHFSQLNVMLFSKDIAA